MDSSNDLNTSALAAPPRVYLAQDPTPLARHVYAGEASPLREQFLGNRAPRMCWCCSPRNGAAGERLTFRTRAHVVSQHLGNRNLLTFDECDKCNAMASQYETALAAMLAPTRILQEHRGRGRRPLTFKHSKHESHLEAIDSHNVIKVNQICEAGEPQLLDGALMRAAAARDAGESELQAILDSSATGGRHEITFRVPVQGYRPINVVKALARLALVVSPQLRERYDHLRRWLLSDIDLSEQLLWHATVCNTPLQLVSVYEYRCDDLQTEHAVLLTFRNRLIWYPLPPSTELVQSTYVPAYANEGNWHCDVIHRAVTIKEGYVEIPAYFSGTVTVEHNKSR